MIVGKAEINRRLRLPITDEQSITITPLLQQEMVLGDSSDQDSIDLRLGSYFLLPQIPPLPFTYPSPDQSKQSHVRVHVPFGSFLVVPAHETVLGATLEFVKLPPDLSGQILTKSSVARTFMVIETAPWVHPSYRGALTLEIANVSNTPLILYPGRLIGQLILMKLEGAMTPRPKIAGSYLAPIYPEAPLFKTPEEELKGLGITGIKTPRVS